MRWDSNFSILAFVLMSFSWIICECQLSVCNNDTTYAYGGTYSKNLNRVISDLFRNTSEDPRYSTSSYGQSPNTVYALLQCVGNITAEMCSECSKKANKTLNEDCANDRGGRVWMDDCFMRYGNNNFISVLDTDGYSDTKGNNINSDVEAFKSTVSSLLKSLSDEAYEPENKGFAIGSANYTSSEKVYGLVQCCRDISIAGCRQCLLEARQEAAICCSTKPAQYMSGSCRLRYDIYPFFGSAESISPDGSPNPTSSTEAHNSEKSSKTLPIILGLAVGLILLFVICLIATRKRVRSAIFGRPLTLVTHNEERRAYSSEIRSVIQEKHFMFSLKELAESTENFDENKKIGVGSFGAMYKGTTRDGKEITVKKLSTTSTKDKRRFMNKMKLLSNVQHRNLVKLLGCCAEGGERLLVYEYFPNKSLDTFLFDLEKRRELSWQKRYNIIIAIARGLLYLHEDSQLKIIHRDIRATNILLDEKLNAKIADFAGDETHVDSNVPGTCGYMAPEYVMQGQLSDKTDVYSFGVLLLEILSGRKNTDIDDIPYEKQNLLEWAWGLYKGEDVLNMVDSTVGETCPEEEALRFIHVGLLCVQADASVRPTMSNVMRMISSSSVALPSPKEPSFINKTKSCGSKSGLKPSSASSGVETTVSSASAVPSENDTSVIQVNLRTALITH